MQAEAIRRCKTIASTVHNQVAMHPRVAEMLKLQLLLLTPRPLQLCLRVKTMPVRLAILRRFIYLKT